MLTELYIFFCQTIPPSLNSLTSNCDKILLLRKCLHRVGLCVQQTGTTEAEHWTEAEWVCLEFLNRYTAALELAAKRVLRHRRHRSWCSLVNKVRVWCTTWQLLQLYLCFITELKWTSTVSAGKRFLPWLGFSSAKLQTSGLQLRGQSAYSVSQRPNWTQTWS